MTKYTVAYTKGKTIFDGKQYLFQTRNKREYVEVIEAIKGLGYTIIHQSHDERRIKI